jgi:hypothetical protein
VFFLEAATQGSWIAKLGQGADAGLSGLFGGGVPGWIADQWGGALLGDIGNVDFRRAGVKDLAPQSGWYRSIVASGTPPRLHYFTLSVDQHIHFKEQLLFWQAQVAESDALGDGVMQLGSTSFGALPGWGGSRFLPFGEAGDQYQYEINVNEDEVFNPAGAAVPLFLLSLNNPYANPYNHFNFGASMGKPNGGGLQVSSCAGSHPLVAIPAEIARVFEYPSGPCGSGGFPVPSAMTAYIARSASHHARQRRIAQPQVQALNAGWPPAPDSL